MLASVSESPSATIPPVSASASTSTPLRKHHSSAMRPIGMVSAAEKSPGGDT